jgi:serine/threonine-protein kinase
VRTATDQGETQKVQLQLPVVVGNRYRLIELRGGGGMAKVYQAIDQTLQREVAVKLINRELRSDPEFDARFQREARIASQLADPHIVVVHDFGLDAVLGPFLVMEYLQGMTLREHLQQEGPLCFQAGLQLFGQLLLALVHAHERSIVHRDIKPDNLFLLNQSGVRSHLRVLDFGIARIYHREAAASSATLTHPGAVLGTPRYMSPEQLAGQPVDARSDIYSAALVIYEALTGQLPYASNGTLCEQCPEISPLFQELLDQCLKANQEDRPKNAVAVYTRLQEIGRASGVAVLPVNGPDHPVHFPGGGAETVPYKPFQARRRSWWVAAALTCLVLGLALALGLHQFLKNGILPAPEKESLLGLEIGTDRDTLIRQLASLPIPEKVHGDPWTGEHNEVLGHVLRREDLAGIPLEDIETLIWSKDRIIVLLHENRICGVIVSKAPAASGRGLKIGDTVETLEKLYSLDLNPEIKIFSGKAEGRTQSRKLLDLGVYAFAKSSKSGKSSHYSGKTYRYEDFGIGFEVVENIVRAITLFPRSEPSQKSPS